MPVYEYGGCPTCGTIEVQQSIKDEPLKFCPNCSKENKQVPITKLISLTTFQLVGGGWAREGYGK